MVISGPCCCTASHHSHAPMPAAMTGTIQTIEKPRLRSTTATGTSPTGPADGSLVIAWRPPRPT
jgi:hypothetical protein